MAFEENFSPVKRGSEKNLCIIFSIVFFVLSIYNYNHISVLYIFLFFSIIFLIFAFTKPSILKFLNVLWFNLGLKLGGIIAPIVMMIIYCIGILPIGILIKIFHFDILNLKYKKNVESHWILRKNKMESMKKQY